MKESKIFSVQNLAEKVHFVYRVTIDGKYYIGKRSGFLNDLHTGAYATSSKLVQEKLKNGMTFSKIKILQVFYSSKDALEFESRILTRVNAKVNPKFLNQHNGSGDFSLRQRTEKTKKKMSKSQSNRWDETTEEGQQRREVQSNKRKEHFNPNTEQGRRNLEKQSQKSKAQFDINSESGIRNRENHSKIRIEFFKTEQGRKRSKNHSEFMKERFNIETEEGRRNIENHSKSLRDSWDKNTELGRKRRENHSNKRKEYFNPETEEGRRNLEIHSEIMKKGAKARLQKRQNASILGELMFDEDFIRQNLLILDDKNNPRFLWSVYAKLTGFKKSSISEQKREGKLSFLHGITSISISEELENAKIQEIKAIIKSRN